MEQQNTDLQQPAAVSEPVLVNATEKPPVALRDRVMALILLALCYLVCRFPIQDRPLLGLAYGLLFYGLTLWHFRFQVGRRALCLFSVGAVFLLSHLLSGNGPVRFFARWFAVLLWGYGVYCAGGNSAEERLGDLFVPECFKANLLMPFSRLGTFFTIVFTGGRRNWLKTVLLMLLGLGLALIPLLLVVNLLQYDPAFEGLLGKLFSESLPEAVFERVLFLMLAVVMAALLMSCLFGSRTHALSAVLDQAGVENFRRRRRFLPLAVSGTMLVPLLAVYGLFFFSQWPIYTSAFTGVLPAGYTYADYAREGFFQLCAVCAINGVLYLFVSLFTRMGKGHGFRRALLTALCLCSLILAATAFSKMVLYIRAYGLTPNRVYASWAMVLLTGAFLLALVGIFCRKLNMTRAMLLLFTVLFGCLCLCDTNALIASYNVRAYEQGRLDSVDTGVFWELGDSAAPAAARLADDPVYGDEVKHFLSYHGQLSAFDALCHGIPGLRARSVCAPYRREPVTVHVRIQTEDDFDALSCWYGEKGYEYCAGICTNADDSPFSRGQKTFFELEQQPYDSWAPAENGTTLSFTLAVSDQSHGESMTNRLSCAYGDTLTVSLTGSAEKGYTIARAD